MNFSTAPAPSARVAIWSLLLLVVSGCAGGSSFPDRPITIVCPWAPGGGSDRICRQLALQLEEELKTPVNVLNAVGGGGVTGHTRGALARPDGYTLTLITSELSMLHWRGLTKITSDDFAPLARVNGDPAALFVRADSPWRDLGDVLAELKAGKPLRTSGTAFGGVWHAALIGCFTAAEAPCNQVTWISINSSIGSLQELGAGGVDLVCCSVPEAQTLIDAKQVRCIAVMNDERLAALPDSATTREAGVDWVLRGYRGLALPTGVPRERREILTAAIERVVQSRKFQEFLTSTGFQGWPAPPQEFAPFLVEEDQRFAALLQSDAFQGVHQAPIGPLAFPQTISVILVATLIALAFAQGRSGVATRTRRIPGRPEVIGMVVVVGWILAYIFLAEALGFVVTAGGLLWGLSLLLGVRPWPAFVWAAAFTAFMWGMAGLLRVQLPIGPWGV